MRENLTSSSYGEGMETDRAMTQVPRQSLTRQLKYDGFRALAHVSDGDCKLISRNGNAFRSFESLRAAIPGDLTPQRAVIDGEIVCLDGQGRSRFTDLLFHRGEPCFVTFDLLRCAGRDLRYLLNPVKGLATQLARS